MSKKALAVIGLMFIISFVACEWRTNKERQNKAACGLRGFSFEDLVKPRNPFPELERVDVLVMHAQLLMKQQQSDPRICEIMQEAEDILREFNMRHSLGKKLLHFNCETQSFEDPDLAELAKIFERDPPHLLKCGLDQRCETLAEVCGQP